MKTPSNFADIFQGKKKAVSHEAGTTAISVLAKTLPQRQKSHLPPYKKKKKKKNPNTSWESTALMDEKSKFVSTK